MNDADYWVVFKRTGEGISLTCYGQDDEHGVWVEDEAWWTVAELTAMDGETYEVMMVDDADYWAEFKRTDEGVSLTCYGEADDGYVWVENEAWWTMPELEMMEGESSVTMEMVDVDAE